MLDARSRYRYQAVPPAITVSAQPVISRVRPIRRGEGRRRLVFLLCALMPADAGADPLKES
ncbi:hypothetical protein Slala03_01190 [Streptomyces lavendulae subsp. lavendulae]|nr:hypothetical protein Slala03_01190 [Streptomyces lavendulae subsp. lavendulae]GLX39181.1 hypothetical protein Sros01_52540 [Streptomyces roseochromogenus]